MTRIDGPYARTLRSAARLGFEMTTSFDIGLTRRDALRAAGCGFGSIALAGIARDAAAGTAAGAAQAGAVLPHVAPHAKRVIFLFMAGGVSHVDSFDYKPRLASEHGTQRTFDDARTLAKTGKVIRHTVMKSPWRFRRHGQSGLWVSELFPRIAEHVDDLCVVRSLHTEGVAHGPATLFLHTGASNLVRPSVGAWVSYGLQAENSDLPAFVSLSPPLANGGPRNYGSAFLPSGAAGTPIGRAGIPIAQSRVRNLVNERLSEGEQRRRFELIRQLNAAQRDAHPGSAEIDAVIASYELGFRMQSTAPRLLELSNETRATQELYGIGDGPTDNFGRQCLLARRMVEAGVRYVQVNYADNSANPAWDQHSNLPKHADHARAVDRPIAGLLADLKRRGLLEETLVWWGCEFGRTPYAERNGTGRDHNPDGFTIWLAGGGAKAGSAFGQTDEFGHHAVVDKVHMHDLHATILRLLGLDHERLTFRYAGRNFRLTDVAGRVVDGIIG